MIPRLEPGSRVVVLAIALACAACSDVRAADTFLRRVVLRDFALEPESWQVLELQPCTPPTSRVLTPAVSIDTDSADRPALVLPPPARVRITIPAESGPLYLRAAAGIDRSARKRLPPGLESATIGFSITVDGKTVLEETIEIERTRPGAWDSTAAVWRHLAGGAGIAVAPGAQVEFATRWIAPAAGVASTKGEILAGFGGLFLERRVTTERTLAAPQTPNIVLVVMDTLRADRLGCYGYARATSPHLDQLASVGLRFAEAYSSASWTFPATASMFTGLAPEAHGVVSNEACTLHQGCTTIAEVLAARGFTTAAFSANPLIAPERYFDQGFETFVVAPGGGCRPSPEILPQALEWLERNAAQRFFLYLHLADPHTPHRPHALEAERLDLPPAPPGWPERGLDALQPDPLLARGGIAPELVRHADLLYDACVASGDRALGELLDRLAALGLEDRTVVVFTSDHGEELLDRGRVGHGHSLHRELMRVPLVVAGPGIPAGRVEPAVVSTRHLASTLAILGGETLAGGEEFLLDPILGQAAFSTHRARYGKAIAPAYGLRTADWLLTWDGQAPTGTLYNLLADPEERADVAGEEAAVAARLRSELAALLAAERAERPGVVLGAGAGGRQDLVELGYLGSDEAAEE